MPLLITQWSSTTVQGGHVTITSTVHNVGKSTAFNAHMLYAGHTKMLLPVPVRGARSVANRARSSTARAGRPVT